MEPVHVVTAVILSVTVTTGQKLMPGSSCSRFGFPACLEGSTCNMGTCTCSAGAVLISLPYETEEGETVRACQTEIIWDEFYINDVSNVIREVELEMDGTFYFLGAIAARTGFQFERYEEFTGRGVMATDPGHLCSRPNNYKDFRRRIVFAFYSSDHAKDPCGVDEKAKVAETYGAKALLLIDLDKDSTLDTDFLPVSPCFDSWSGGTSWEFPIAALHSYSTSMFAYNVLQDSVKFQKTLTVTLRSKGPEIGDSCGVDQPCIGEPNAYSCKGGFCACNTPYYKLDFFECKYDPKFFREMLILPEKSCQRAIGFNIGERCNSREGRYCKGFPLEAECRNGMCMCPPDTNYNLGLDQCVPRCGETLRATMGEIAIPRAAGGDNSYADNLDCSWEIIANPGQVIRVFLGSFKVAKSDDSCSGDYAEIIDKGQTDSPSLGRFCGQTFAPPFVTSISNVIEIKFISNSVTQDESGKGLKYQSFEPTDAVKEIYSRAGTIRESDFDSVGSQWFDVSIITAMSRRVTITIAGRVGVEEDCQTDYIQILDGPLSVSPVLAQLCGQIPSQTMMSSHGAIYFRLRTRSMTTVPNILITYHTDETGCGTTLTGMNGTFTSPMYTLLPIYTTLDCEWTIEVPEDHFIKFMPIELELKEAFLSCNADHVTDHVQILPIDGLHTVYCNLANEETEDFTTFSNKATVRFHARYLAENEGFIMSYTTVPDPGRHRLKGHGPLSREVTLNIGNKEYYLEATAAQTGFQFETYKTFSGRVLPGTSILPMMLVPSYTQSIKGNVIVIGLFDKYESIEERVKIAEVYGAEALVILSNITEQAEVDLPVSPCYNKWSNGTSWQFPHVTFFSPLSYYLFQKIQDALVALQSVTVVVQRIGPGLSEVCEDQSPCAGSISMKCQLGACMCNSPTYREQGSNCVHDSNYDLDELVVPNGQCSGAKLYDQNCGSSLQDYCDGFPLDAYCGLSGRCECQAGRVVWKERCVTEIPTTTTPRTTTTRTTTMRTTTTPRSTNAGATTTTTIQRTTTATPTTTTTRTTQSTTPTTNQTRTTQSTTPTTNQTRTTQSTTPTTNQTRTTQSTTPTTNQTRTTQSTTPTTNQTRTTMTPRTTTMQANISSSTTTSTIPRTTAPTTTKSISITTAPIPTTTRFTTTTTETTRTTTPMFTQTSTRPTTTTARTMTSTLTAAQTTTDTATDAQSTASTTPGGTTTSANPTTGDRITTTTRDLGGTTAFLPEVTTDSDGVVVSVETQPPAVSTDSGTATDSAPGETDSVTVETELPGNVLPGSEIPARSTDLAESRTTDALGEIGEIGGTEYDDSGATTQNTSQLAVFGLLVVTWFVAAAAAGSN